VAGLLDDVRALLARVELAEQNAQLVAVMEGMLQDKESINDAKESVIVVKESIIKTSLWGQMSDFFQAIPTPCCVARSWRRAGLGRFGR
jgi:hypothetical protein